MEANKVGEIRPVQLAVAADVRKRDKLGVRRVSHKKILWDFFPLLIVYFTEFDYNVLRYSAVEVRQ